MAKRRLISEALLYDEGYNALPILAQLLFIRLLVRSDDCGVVPASGYELRAMLNLPQALYEQLDELLQEIAGKGLGHLITYDGKRFFVFKRDSFLKIQSYILNKRTRSEYLNISVEVFDSEEFQANVRGSGIFLEALGKSKKFWKTSAPRVESRKKKVERKDHREPKQISSTPEGRIYEQYAVTVRPGARADALRNIKQLVADGHTEQELLQAVGRYAKELPEDRKFRIQANNFFGKAERWKEFSGENGTSITAPKTPSAYALFGKRPNDGN